MISNQKMSPSPAMALRAITIVHIGLIAGQVLFGAMAFLQSRSLRTDVRPADDVYIYLVPFMALGGFIASNFLYKQKLNTAMGKYTLKEKLVAYQSALIVRYSLLEGPSLFGIIVYILTGNLLFLLISIAIVVYFILIRPSRDKVETELNLNYEEKAELDNRTGLSNN